MKKSLSIILSVLMIISTISFMPFSADAANNLCGDNVYYYYTASDGTMNIMGTGNMYNFTDNTVPWAGYAADIKEVNIFEGVTSIGEYAFNTAVNLKKIGIPATMKTIGQHAFWGCDNLETVNYYSTNDDWLELDIRNDNSPLDLAERNYYLRGKCGDSADYILDLQTGTLGIDGRGEMYDYDDESNRSPFFLNEDIISVIIAGSITTIGNFAFDYCTNLESVEIPNSVTTIGVSAFDSCYNLKTVTMGIGVKTISDFAFNFCPKIETLNYAGTKEDWKKITIGINNESIIMFYCDHVPDGPASREDIEAATCTKKGRYDMAVYCAICGDVISREVHYVPALGHKYKEKITKATLTKKGKVIKTCTRCNYRKESVIQPASNITISPTSYTYNGSVRLPNLVVKDADGYVIAKDEYSKKYSKGRKNVGTYSITVTFNGSYFEGSKVLKFKINPKETKLKTVTSPSSKTLKVRWTKQTTQASGYIIQIATDKDFKKNVKSYTVSGMSKDYKTISGLKRRTKYYVRIKTYARSRNVNDNGTYYSGWSSSMSAVTKR